MEATMRLSEAVALGLPEIEFTNAVWFQVKQDGTCEGCLVGAALWAMGKRDMSGIVGDIYALWPWAKQEVGIGLRCPGPHYFSYEIGEALPPVEWSILTTLTHLASHYERGELTSAQIVDFIRSIEARAGVAGVTQPDVPLGIQLAESVLHGT